MQTSGLEAALLAAAEISGATEVYIELST